MKGQISQYVGLAASLALLSGGATGDILVAGSANAVVDVDEISPNRWTVEIEQVNAGSTTVILRGTDSDDVIERILIRDTGLAATAENVLLRIQEGGSPTRTSIGAIEEIAVESGNGVRVRVGRLFITGDVGAPGAANRIEGRLIEELDIGGDCYADMVLVDPAPTGPQSVFSINIDGDWLEGGIYNNEGNIAEITVAGNVGPSLVEFWAKGTLTDITIGGDATNLRIGSNGMGFSGNSAVGSLDVDGDFDS